MTSNLQPDGSTLVEIYRRAMLIHHNDARVRAALKSGKIAASYYSPRGQEIIPSAISVLLTDDDYLVTTYRGIHDQVAKGVPLRGSSCCGPNMPAASPARTRARAGRCTSPIRRPE